jgi:hypothetical protein
VDRQEAVNLLKEIVSFCDGINESMVILMPHDAGSVLSHGYQLHIKAWSTHKEGYNCIKPIIDKRALAVSGEPEQDLLIIYSPADQAEIEWSPL